MNIWQVAAGDGSRDYSDVFLRFGVVLVGPGDAGPYFDNQPAYRDKQHPGYYRGYLPAFCDAMREGEDLVILKRPCGQRWEIVAVGMVQSKYSHEPVFEDVEGWDLQHCRRVAWKLPSETTVIQGLRRGTFYGVGRGNARVREKAIEVWEQGVEHAPEDLPAPGRTIDVDEVIDVLVEHGLSVTDAQTVTSTIWRLRRLAKWYNSAGAEVGEFEVRSFLIIPLVLALGWPEQNVKIEWRKIDVAVFERPYASGSEPAAIIESKRLWSGLRYASEQAKAAAEAYSGCTRLIVSDGIRYRLFDRTGSSWRYAAYANLLAPKDKHPYDREVMGAKQLFRQMLPR